MKGGRRFVERWGRYLLLDPADLDRVNYLFHHFGGWTVLIARLLASPRTEAYVAEYRAAGSNAR